MAINIESIDIYKIDIPMKFPFKIALGTSTEANNVLIRVNTNDGIYGWGEACSSYKVTGNTQNSSYEAAIKISKKLKNQNPLAVIARMDEIETLFTKHTQIKSAFNSAFYDILAKKSNLPLYHILGGHNRRIMTDYTLGIQEELESAVHKINSIIKKGFKAIKLKVGLNRELDVKLIKTIRENLDNKIEIRIDANQGWDLPLATQVLKEIEPYNIQYAEQPLPYWDYSNMKKLRERTSIPICADESLHNHHDAFKLASMGACDYLNIKLGKSKGITTALKINAIAESCALKCMIGCFNETRLGLSFAAHLVAAAPNIKFIDLDSALMHKNDYVKGGITYENGDIIIPNLPGHGADIREDILENLEKITI